MQSWELGWRHERGPDGIVRFCTYVFRIAVVVWKFLIDVPTLNGLFPAGIVLVGGSFGGCYEMFRWMAKERFLFLGVHGCAFDVDRVFRILVYVFFDLSGRPVFHDFVGFVFIRLQVDQKAGSGITVRYARYRSVWVLALS